MKKLHLIPLLAGALMMAACNGNSPSSDSSQTDSLSGAITNSDTASSMAVPTVGNDERDFAKEAATGGMMEVQLGQIAMKNSSTQTVKDFGKMMVDDHTSLNNQFKDLASKKNVDLPSMVTDDQQKEIDKLSGETGRAFDKDYVNMMVEDHQKDIAAFKKAGDKLTDNDFKEFIIKALPTLQKHLDAIQAIKDKMK